MLTAQRFSKQLAIQLAFIATSARLYDSGEETEAVRIGTALRVICHSTPQSTSLLKHLGAEGTVMASTAGGSDPPVGVLLSEAFVMIGGTAGMSPALGRGSQFAELPFRSWWSQVVLVNNAKRFSRRDIVLMAVNRDGGAHVDATLPSHEQGLVEGIWHRATREDLSDGALVPNHHYLYLRQIGYEVLASPGLCALAK